MKKKINNTLYSVTNNDINLDGSFTIPDGVTSIGDRAFYYCSSLTSVTIPDSVTSIGDYAFYYCISLKDVYYQGNISGWLGISFGGSDSNPCCNGAKLYFNGELVESITMPAGVTSIGSYAFYGCRSLTNITIPDGVTSIGDRAFAVCSSLANITFAEGSQLTIIGNYAFYNCSSLTSQPAIYKGFEISNGELNCRGYTYQIGKWSKKIDNPKLCDWGYHFCTNLFDVFNYYPGRYDTDFCICICEAEGVTDEIRDDSKKVCEKIKPVRRLTRQEVIDILNEGVI